MSKIFKSNIVLFYAYALGILSLILFFALTIEYYIFNYKDKNDALSTGEMIIQQTGAFIDQYRSDEKMFIAEVKSEYLNKATIADYIISLDPKLEHDTSELHKLASVMNVDEIHIFNERGYIYTSTLPDAVGLSMDSGEQIGFFKPMLANRYLKLAQNITPNTAKNQEMFYAMVWSITGDKMVQVGITPSRYMVERQRYRIPYELIAFPKYQGYTVRIARSDNGKIVSASDPESIGKNLQDFGFDNFYNASYQTYEVTKQFGDKTLTCLFRVYKDFVVGVFYDPSASTTDLFLSLVIILVYLTIAGFIIIVMVRRVVKAKEERDSQFSVLKSLSEIYSLMYVIDLRDDTIVEYISFDATNKEGVKKISNATFFMNELSKEKVAEEHRDASLAFTDLSTLSDRMIGKKTIFQEFIDEKNGWFRAAFIVIEHDENERPVRVLFTSQTIDEDKRKVQNLERRSYSDELTLCLNRRAYERDVMTLSGSYVYVSLDVNGLKNINDVNGHVAGDELIVGAANCIKSTFAKRGHVYRVGGDEFVAIVKTNLDQFLELKKQFDDKTSKWKGTLVDKLHISVGYVHSSEIPECDIVKISAEADRRMYQDKSDFYHHNGVDRRSGRQEAISVLTTLCMKILRVDLTIDSMIIVSAQVEDLKEEKLENASISNWFNELANNGFIHPNDVPNFVEKTSLTNLKSYFDSGKRRLSISYRRRTQGGSFQNFVMDLVASGSYTRMSQVVYLFVRSIE